MTVKMKFQCILSFTLILIASAASAHPHSLAGAMVNQGAQAIKISPPAKGEADKSTTCVKAGNSIVCTGPEGTATCNKVGVSTVCTSSNGTTSCNMIGDSTLCTSASATTSCTLTGSTSVCTGSTGSFACTQNDKETVCKAQ